MLIPACTLLFLTLFCSDSTANPPVPTPEVEVDEAGCRLDLSARPARFRFYPTAVAAMNLGSSPLAVYSTSKRRETWRL